ncbi:MAG TPA: TonB-dependent receptor [Thermoanaerobaculia bacterium]|nr:TonB-dependent receptor [Thermoanaerobaculia bacterium]
MARRLYPRLALVVAVLLLALTALPVLAQDQTGDLYGTALDEQKQPLPGVTVTVTGVGAPQVQQSDAQGKFRFLKLYPGSYALKAELEGFSTVERPDLTIKLGGKVSIEVTLNGAVKDVITVTGESPLLDERKIDQGTNISTVALDKVPTARDPWSLLSQAPGVLVDRVNVGGNESGQQSNFIGVGSNGRDNTFTVDGVVLTDMNAVGGSATYFDFGAFEEVQFTVSSADVTVQTSGVTINQVTKRGTNDWRGNARYLDTDGSLQAKPQLVDGNKIDKVEEYGADIGGPLIKDHLWVWGAYGVSDIRNIVQGGQLDKTKLEDYNYKLNFQATQNDSGVLHYWTNNKLKFGRDAGPDREPATTHDQTTPQDIYKIEDTLLASSNWSITGLYSRDTGKFTLSPEGGLTPNDIIDADGVHRGTDYFFKQDATIEQEKLDSSYFFNTGSAGHELKFGGSFREQANNSGTVWPHGNRVFSGALLGLDGDEALVEFPRDRKNKITSDYGAAWIQDTISVSRLTANVGVRYDRQYMKNLPSFDAGNPDAQGLLPPINFKGNDAGGFSWNTFEPRLGVTYALGEKRQTLLRGTFSRYAEQLGQLPLATRVNPIGYNYAYFYFEDTNHNLVLDPNEVGSLQFAYTYNIDPNNPSAVPNITNPNLRPTLTNELTFSVDQGFGANLEGGLTFTYRDIFDVPELRTLVVDESGATRVATRDDYVQVGTVTGTLPNGQTVTKPYYDLRDGLTPTGGTYYTNGDRKQRYLGATLSLNKRLSNNWGFQGHFTYNDWTWQIGPNFKKYDDPTDTLNDTLGFPDENSVFFEHEGGNKADVFTGSRWSFNMNGIYQIAPERPWGVNFALNFTGREGYISPPYIRKGGSIGSRDIQLATIDEFRNPDIYVLDARIDKDFKFSDFNLTLSLDGFNLTNRSYVLQRERDALAGRFDQPDEELSPRILRLGATLRFR